MPVVVMFAQGATEVVKEGASWAVDDHGYLSVYGENSDSVPLATFASGTWLFAKSCTVSSRA